MITRLPDLLKMSFYRLKYGKKIIFRGVPSISKNAEIKIKQGKMVISRGFLAKPGTYFAVVNGGQLSLNERVSFGRDCVIVCHDSITIGNNVHIGPHVMIYDHDHVFDSEGIQQGFRTSQISIGNNCWIGAGVIVLRGTVIGEGCVIGAGCVIKGTIPPHSLVTSGRDLIITPLEDRKKTK